MGMGLDTYLGLSHDQFWRAYRDWEGQRRRDRETDGLNQWQIARWQAWRELCPPDKKSLSQFDLIELPGDKETMEYLYKKRREKTKKPKEPMKDEKRFRAVVKRWESK